MAVKAVVVDFQALYRKYSEQRRYTSVKKALVSLQASFRRRSSRKKMLAVKSSCKVIQTWWRARQARLAFLERRADCIVLQAFVRAALLRQQYRFTQECVQRIQCFLRCAYARTVVRTLAFEKTMSEADRLARRVSARRIVTWCRTILLKKAEVAAAIRIQNFYRSGMEALEERRQHRAVLKIQSLVRGHTARMSSAPRIKQARTQIKVATAKWTEDTTLANRTAAALHWLLTTKNMTKLTHAVSSLEVSTRYAVVCAEVVVRHGAPQILVELISTCNRSEPHIKVMILALKTLVHMSSIPSTCDCVFSVPNLVDVLVDTMQKFRDKLFAFTLCGSIFEKNVRRPCPCSSSRQATSPDQASSVHIRHPERKLDIEKNLRASKRVHMLRKSTRVLKCILAAATKKM